MQMLIILLLLVEIISTLMLPPPAAAFYEIEIVKFVISSLENGLFIIYTYSKNRTFPRMKVSFQNIQT